jgi:pimeloyl-ACP methyl ester carboxylesterase
MHFLVRRLILLLALAAGGAGALAEPVGQVISVATREGITVPIYALWQPDARATVVLFSGGRGGYGQIGEDGWPAGGNFLVRTGKRWAAHPLNVVMVGRPTDGIDLALGTHRTGDRHAADNLAIFKAIKARSPAPLWLVGTSMGTISATAAAIRDEEGQVAGLVLTASIVAYKVPGAVPTQALDKVRVPTLIVHHEADACWACRPHEVRRMADAFVNAPLSKTVFVGGGEGVAGNPCEPLHHHGFVGVRDQVVDLIADWIVAPAR